MTTIQEFVAGVQTGTALILRGVPGAGKSTLTQKLDERLDVVVCSADAHRMVAGAYVFDATKNGDAHAACLRDFVDEISSTGKDVVVCDNTNIQPVDAAPYYALAVAYGWRPMVVTVVLDPVTAAARNVHGVPPNRVRDMAEQLDRQSRHLPTRWTCITVQGE